MTEPIPIRKQRKRKLSDTDITNARRLILRGRSLRSVAKYYRVHHTSLRERLIHQFGDYRRGHQTTELLAEYAACGNPRLAAAAAEFLSNYQPTDCGGDFYTTKQENDRTLHTSRYVLDAERFNVRRGGLSCKIA